MIDSFSQELELNMIQKISRQLKSESIWGPLQCKLNVTVVYFSKYIK